MFLSDKSSGLRAFFTGLGPFGLDPESSNLAWAKKMGSIHLEVSTIFVNKFIEMHSNIFSFL